MKFTIMAMAFLIMSSATAIEFEKGSEVGDIHPRLLRRMLQQGKSSFNGSKIVYDSKADVPARYQKKWDEKKLTGESVPQPGQPGPNVIFVKSF